MVDMDVGDFVEQSLYCSSVEQLFSLFQKYMSSYGYDRLLLALMTDHPRLHKSAEHGVEKSYPQEWFDHYMAEGYDHIDPIRQQIYLADDALIWKKIVDTQALTKKQKRLFHEAQEHGLHGGIAIPLRGPGGVLAAMGAASSERDASLSRVDLDKVNLITQQFYACYSRLHLRSPDVPSPALSSKEKDVLKWLAVGLTKAEVGQRLCISEHTVAFHVRSITRKLEVRNLTAAVALAVSSGLILI